MDAPAGFLTPDRAKRDLLQALWPSADWRAERDEGSPEPAARYVFVEQEILLSALVADALTAWVIERGTPVAVPSARWQDVAAGLYVAGGTLNMGAEVYPFYFERGEFASLKADVLSAWTGGKARPRQAGPTQGERLTPRRGPAAPRVDRGQSLLTSATQVDARWYEYRDRLLAEAKAAEGTPAAETAHPPIKRARNRPKGSGVAGDDLLVSKMHPLVENGKTKKAAAAEVLGRGVAPPAVIARLVRKYGATYGSSPLITAR